MSFTQMSKHLVPLILLSSLCSLSVLMLVAVVFMVPMKDRSDDVLSFLNGALDVAPATQSTSGKIKGPQNPSGKPAPTPGPQNPSGKPAPTPGPQNPSGKPAPTPGPQNPCGKPAPTPARPSPLRPTENSADVVDSDDRSKEKCNSDDLTDAERSESNSAESREDYDDSLGSNTKITQTVTDNSSSDETDSSPPSDVRKYKQPPGRRTINPDHVDSMQTTTRQTTTRQDPTNGSEELDRAAQRDPTVGRERTSRVLIDLNSEEDVMVGCQGTVCVPGEQGTTVNGETRDDISTETNPVVIG
ncbi:putative uncharacterized protein DDB_G0290521 isoform X2 [Oncorhynchus masou masou]|uniref:putative uncharacterized protein DDB_G0290521 isoform X2 n=1 Tax=Oncorhynchus masou masou TaxID=90313 RepID=UPI003183CEA7